MAITLFGVASGPADGGAQSAGASRALTPPASMVTGDLVDVIVACRGATETLSVATTGGQTWNSETLRQGNGMAVRRFWCRFNGTWGANPAWVSGGLVATDPLSIFMSVWRPTTGTNTWAIDVAEDTNTFTGPVAPSDVTATGRTTLAANTVSIFTFVSLDENTWAIQTGGFTNAGTAQYRNSTGGDLSLSTAYLIKTSAGATGSVTNRQLTLGGDAGRWLGVTFKEQGSGLTISNADDETYYNGESGVTITGTTFGAAKGAGFVKISPTDNIADGSAVTQPTSAWGDTSITLSTLDLSSFSYFTNLYLFVQSNAGASNSSGVVVQREARMYVRETLQNLAAAAIASVTNIRYRVSDATLNGTLLLSGLTEGTSGAGAIDIGPYTLTNGGDLSPGDDVWVVLAIEGASQATSQGTCVKITPDYE